MSTAPRLAVVGRLKPRTFKARGLNRSLLSSSLNADGEAAPAAAPEQRGSPADDAHQQQNGVPPYRGLSDEVLEQIFEELHSLFQTSRTRVPPLRYLFLSKRVYTIARPIWLSAISTKGRSSTAGSDLLLARLVTDPTVRPLVRQLEMTFFRAFAQTQIAILTLLDNLRSLDLSFDESWQKRSSGAKFISTTLLDAIASRPHLEELKFFQHVEAKLPSPQPVNYRPLQSFTAPIHSIKNGLLEYLAVRRVKKLRLAVFLDHHPFTGDLPWDNLTTIIFDITMFQNNVRPAPFDVPEALGRQLFARSNPDAATLNVGLVLDSKVPSGTGADALLAFLNAFASRRTCVGVRVEPGSSLVLPVLDDDQEPWSLIETFFFNGVYALTEGRNLAELAAFLDNMPEVTYVKLRQVKLTTSSSKGPTSPPPPISSLNDDRLGLEYAHLAVLLSHIARSKITQFEITSPSQPGPVCWARETAKDPLVRVE